MSSQEIPSEIRKFIFEHIDSVEQLEVLLLLRAQPQREWSATEISSELRSLPDSVAKRLVSLHAHGFLAATAPEPARYRYSPANSELDEGARAISDAYRERRITIIQLIFSRPQGALDALRSFADAFKIKRDDHDR